MNDHGKCFHGDQQRIPSLTYNKSELGMTMKVLNVALGLTKTIEVLLPRGGTNNLSCVQTKAQKNSYLTLCKSFIKKASSVIISTWHVGSTITPVTV